MKQFNEFFTESEILRQICKVRVKISKNRSKKHLLHILTTHEKYNYHQEPITPRNEFEQYQADLVKLLSEILPPRKKWVKLGLNSRRKRHNASEFLSSNDKNFYALLKTIRLHKKKKSNERWFQNLMEFVRGIKESINEASYSVSKPIIFPKLKEKKKNGKENECRPICIFNLQDRIVLSITNKFLTRLFDKHFSENAFAFRAKRNIDNQILSHHDCILEILSFTQEQQNDELYVFECDMRKFYDTVNHKIVKQEFEGLITKSKIDHPSIELNVPSQIFNSYLNSYAFNFDVPDKSDFRYWNSYGIKDGNFTWVDDSISEYYLDKKSERIGVPQGGALSGLIANIYLAHADNEVQTSKVLYQRFCDDMIVISNDLHECLKAKELYLKALHQLKLFPHSPKNETELKKLSDLDGLKAFWDGKSKGPYRWGSIENGCFPWIGFVGYEINRDGDIRIRKKSFQKELKKQKQIVNEIKDAIEIGMRKPKGTATESAINRLIGMSVGRIGLDNFDEVSTDLCWKNGFKELTLNKHSVRQIKQLDRNRSKLYYKLLKEIKDPDLPPEKKSRQREVVQYNKPFSYYYQVLERQRKR